MLKIRKISITFEIFRAILVTSPWPLPLQKSILLSLRHPVTCIICLFVKSETSEEEQPAEDRKNRNEIFYKRIVFWTTIPPSRALGRLVPGRVARASPATARVL